MKRNGFTLIELLVVVAIIGILAAVGVVAYNGYTASAKKNVTKANSDLIFKYVKTETFKCELDSSSGIMDFNGTSLLSCSDLTYPGASVAKVVQAIKKILDEKVKILTTHHARQSILALRLIVAILVEHTIVRGKVNIILAWVGRTRN